VLGLDPAVVDELWLRVAPHLEQMRTTGAGGSGSSGSLGADSPTLALLLDAFGRRP
jgi:hypothetical protein